MSYSKNRQTEDDATPFNHFVVFDELNVLACHDYKVLAGGHALMNMLVSQNLYHSDCSPTALTAPSPILLCTNLIPHCRSLVSACMNM